MERVRIEEIEKGKIPSNLASNLPPKQPHPSNKTTESSSATNPQPGGGARRDRAHSPGSQSLKNLSTSAQNKKTKHCINPTNPRRLAETRSPIYGERRRTGGEGLDHAGAAGAVVAEDLLRGARRVRRRPGAPAVHRARHAGAMAVARVPARGRAAAGRGETSRRC